MSLFVDISKEALPKRRILVNTELLVFLTELSISLIVPKWIYIGFINNAGFLSRFSFDGYPSTSEFLVVKWISDQYMKKSFQYMCSLINLLLKTKLWWNIFLKIWNIFFTFNCRFVILTPVTWFRIKFAKDYF